MEILNYINKHIKIITINQLLIGDIAIEIGTRDNLNKMIEYMSKHNVSIVDDIKNKNEKQCKDLCLRLTEYIETMTENIVKDCWQGDRGFYTNEGIEVYKYEDVHLV
jgi:Holliday junction resolvasome RuvABC DNA-binding subunit